MNYLTNQEAVDQLLSKDKITYKDILNTALYITREPSPAKPKVNKEWMKPGKRPKI